MSQLNIVHYSVIPRFCESCKPRSSGLLVLKNRVMKHLSFSKAARRYFSSKAAAVLFPKIKLTDEQLEVLDAVWEKKICFYNWFC